MESEALTAENVCTVHVASLPWGEQTPPSGRPASKTAIVHGQVWKIAQSLVLRLEVKQNMISPSQHY